MKSLSMLQELQLKPAYRVDEIIELESSRATAYKRLRELEQLGLIERTKRGYYTVRTCVKQPLDVMQHLLPTLQALKQARTFGKYYNESDVRIARSIIDDFVTLDYKAYELTKYQTPARLFIYVDDIQESSEIIRKHGFSQGTKGSVTLLPRIGDFTNEIQRVYLDCIAYGGRSTQDAVAIELLYGSKLKINGYFPVELINKVREDMPLLKSLTT